MFKYPIYYPNWRNISAINIYNKTSIKQNILTIKKKIHQEVGRAKDLSAPLYVPPSTTVKEDTALVEFMTLRYSYDIYKQHYTKESSFSLILCVLEVMLCGM